MDIHFNGDVIDKFLGACACVAMYNVVQARTSPYQKSIISKIGCVSLSLCVGLVTNSFVSDNVKKIRETIMSVNKEKEEE